MIIGEPIMLGGKGETASIFVTGLTETDTVTASKDGKTWQGVWGSKVISGVVTYGHLISRLNSYGTYTVTATDGSKTATEIVLVDKADEFDIEMSFAEKSTYLYYLGDECEDITGGWEALAVHATSGYTALAPTVVKTSTTTRLYHTPSAIAIGSYMTVDFIDATDFTGVMVYATETNASSDGWVQFFGFRTRSGSGQTLYWNLGEHVGKSSHPTGPIIGTFSYKTNNEAYFAITEYYYGGTTSITYKAIAFFKADNISGLSEYGATISEILSNSATLLASENGVREMLKCTGDFMWNALANSTWLSAYNSSAYKSVIDSNSTWAKALALL